MRSRTGFVTDGQTDDGDVIPKCCHYSLEEKQKYTITQALKEDISEKIYSYSIVDNAKATSFTIALIKGTLTLIYIYIHFELKS
jgi:hypothetical protein